MQTHSQTQSIARIFLALALLLVLAACASGTKESGKSGAGGGIYKVGEPYQINGNWYYPREDYSYDETGIASWYGSDFHGGATANGEVFNKDELTAAHKTLPLPSLARVTNLDNGRSIVVRVNDRGPFAGSRLIDVSQRASQLLGFEKQGTAKVRVQVLADESRAIADALRRYGGSTPKAAEENSMTVAAAPAPVSAPLSSVSSQELPPPPGMQAAPQPSSQAVQTVPLTVENVRPVPEVKHVTVVGANQIYIQGGAFTQQDNAQRMQTQLSKFGETHINEAVVNGTKFYRVRLGPLSDVTAGDAMLHRVTQSGVRGARIVVE